MDTIIHVLNQKWAVLLAFIPGVNLLYLIFRIVVRTNGACEISFLKCCLIGIPFCFLYHFVPDSWDWLVTHLMLSAIAIYVMVKSRGCYYPELKYSIGKIVYEGVFVIFAILLIRVVPKFVESNQVDRFTEGALYALVQDDEATWQEFMHPEHGQHLMDLQQFKKDLDDNGIILNEDFIFRVRRSASSTEYVEEGEGWGQDHYIRSDEELYRVVVTYQKTESGKGFVEFQIIPEKSYSEG